MTGKGGTGTFGSLGTAESTLGTLGTRATRNREPGTRAEPVGNAAGRNAGVLSVFSAPCFGFLLVLCGAAAGRKRSTAEKAAGK